MIEEDFCARCWHISREGKQNGPYTLAELLRLAESENLKAEDLVWKPGLTNWKSVLDLPGILAPPPRHYTPPPVPSPAVQKPPNDTLSIWIEQTPRRWARNGTIIGAIWSAPFVASSGNFMVFSFAILLGGFAYIAGQPAKRRLAKLRESGTSRFSAAISALPIRYAAWGAAVGSAISFARHLSDGGNAELVTGTAGAVGYFLGPLLVCALIGSLIGAVQRWGARKCISEDEPNRSFRESVGHDTGAAPVQRTGRGPNALPTNPRFEFPQSRAPTRSENIIARYWRGELPLWVSYWIFGFLGNLAAGLIALLVVDVFLGNREYQPMPIFFAFLFMWLSIGLLGSWQIVGVWRSASRYTTERHRAGKTAFWGGAAQFMTIIGFLALVQAFGTAGLPQMAETYRMAWLGDPDIPDYSLRIMRNGTELEVTGGFKYGLTDDVLRLMSASPQIRVVHLDSLGGRVGEAQKLHNVIAKKGLITFVSGSCMSACTLAYAAGRERWLHKDASLGFHASSFPGMGNELYIDPEQKRAFRKAGFADDFIARALTTPHEKMWIPQLDELLESKVVTAVSDGSEFAVSGFGGTLTLGQMRAMLTKALPALTALEKKSPESHASIIDTFYAAYLGGETLESVRQKARDKFLPLIQKYTPLADDEVLVAYGQLVADQYAALGKIDPELCYLVAHDSGRRNYSSSLPADLLKRELILQERIIATAKRRASISQRKTDRLWQMIVNRMEPSHVEILEKEPSPETYRDYCDASISMMEAITSLSVKQSGLVLRELWSTP